MAVRRGETDPLFGWVTTGLSEREAAPVLNFSQQSDSAWFVTAILPSTASEGLQPNVTAERTTEGFRIVVATGDREWSVILPHEGNPTIES